MKRLQRYGGFTLVEIMVAILVLVILALIFAQITSLTSRAIHYSNQSVDAASEAYLSFDRLRMDLSALVKRPDLDFNAQNLTTSPFIGNTNILLFLANVASSGLSATANRNISMVAYQVNTSADNGNKPCLLRAGMAVGWANSSFMGIGTSGASNGLPLAFTDSNFPPALLPGTADFDVLAPGVIRMVIGFQLYPDNLPVTLSDGSTPTPSTGQGQIVYNPPIRALTPIGGGTAVNYIDLRRVASIVVGVVAVDVNTLKPVTAAQITSVAGAFPLPTNGTLPLQAWSSVADNLGGPTGPTSVPLPMRQAVHVFQQSFPVTPYGMKGS